MRIGILIWEAGVSSGISDEGRSIILWIIRDRLFGSPRITRPYVNNIAADPNVISFPRIITIIHVGVCEFYLPSTYEGCCGTVVMTVIVLPPHWLAIGAIAKRL
ncbi:hypothetical protein NS226_17635 [Aureimonas ureilytica]|uniref:Uncharacterized protein n=1 Tax=Aureimonas ureilytica TaxID=401562 RepID=A0A175R511_9HYPH|nr:hypothetical protein NS226_17635 [Aureimonas ureilytica]